MQNSENKLSTVKWDINQSCNLKCKHCLISNNNAQIAQIDIRKQKIIAKKIVEFGAEKVYFQSMEPLLNKNIFSLIEYFSKNNVSTGVVTNGILLDDENIQKLLHSGVQFISVSIDGISEESHDYIRGKGSFKKTIRNVERLINAIKREAYNIQIIIQLCIHKKNIHEVMDIPSYFNDLGINILNIGNISNTGNAKLNKEILCEYNDIIIVYEKIMNAYSKLNCKNYIIFPKSLMPNHALNLNIKYDLNLPIKPSGCSITLGNISVNKDGVLKGCNLLNGKFMQPFLDICNTFDNTIISECIQDNKKFFNKLILEHNSTINFRNCSGCNFKEECKFCPLIEEEEVQEYTRSCSHYRKNIVESFIEDLKKNNLEFNSNVYYTISDRIVDIKIRCLDGSLVKKRISAEELEIIKQLLEGSLSIESVFENNSLIKLLTQLYMSGFLKRRDVC